MGRPMTLDDLPASVLFDLLQDAAAVLTGLYLERQRDATQPDDASRWWDKVIAVRDHVRSADPDDRAALVEQITRWRREAAELNTD